MVTRSDSLSIRSSLSINADEEDREIDDNDDGPSLQTRILDLVKSSPNLTIRPARVSYELGMSINDASAELCGLLSAVGEGSSFHFEDIEGVKTMVFSFPPDFEAKALRKQRSEDLKSFFVGSAKMAIKALKVLTAFGLIISLLILTIAAMLAIFALIIAMSRGDSRGYRNNLTRQMGRLFLTARELLWCFALFGPDHAEGQNSFLREIAYDMWLCTSLCCGNPSSFIFWHRAAMWNRRRRVRGWGRTLRRNGSMESTERIHLLRRGTWGVDPVDDPVVTNSVEDYKGLLSIAVEFLFGTSLPPRPTEAEKWRLRAAVIEQYSLSNGHVSLEDLIPYADDPPSSLLQKEKIVSEGLLVVVHFDGVPAEAMKLENPSKAKFVFPELIAESHVSTRYNDLIDHSVDEMFWEGLLYAKEAQSARVGTATQGEIPSYMRESRQVFTNLQSKQFFHCLLLAVLNLVGVIWFAQSLKPGGILEPYLGAMADALQWGLIPVLKFYSQLFFAIPATRLLWILGVNAIRKRRNETRKALATALKGNEIEHS